MARIRCRSALFLARVRRLLATTLAEAVEVRVIGSRSCDFEVGLGKGVEERARVLENMLYCYWILIYARLT
jgi:hypothetical protein